MPHLRVLAAAALLLPLPASSAGFNFGDNGAQALGQGFAFTGQADDLSAIQHNPAGLTQLKGLHFLADLNLLDHQVSFLREDPGFDPAAPSTQVATVHNTGGLFLLPFLAVSYGLEVAGRPLTLGLGVYAPPTVGRSAYAEPDYTKSNGSTFDQNPRKFAPQRYALINNDLVIAYPTLSAAYSIDPHLQVGLSLQLVVSHFFIRQALFAGDALGSNPQRQLDENPDFDVLATVDVTGQVGVTGILGLMFRPTTWLAIGASVRPPVPIKATGKLGLQLSPLLASAGSVEGDRATLTFTLPLEAKLGVYAQPHERVGLAADFVFQGWNSVDALTMTPDGVVLVQGTTRTEIAPVRLVKNWEPSYSARLGGSFELFPRLLTVRAGWMYETGASTSLTYSVDFPHPSRMFVTAGLTVHLWAFDLVGGLAWTPTVTSSITESQVRRQQTDPTQLAGVIGTGVYTSGGFIGTVGLRGHFLEPASKVVESDQ